MSNTSNDDAKTTLSPLSRGLAFLEGLFGLPPIFLSEDVETRERSREIEQLEEERDKFKKRLEAMEALETDPGKSEESSKPSEHEKEIRNKWELEGHLA